MVEANCTISKEKRKRKTHEIWPNTPLKPKRIHFDLILHYKRTHIYNGTTYNSEHNLNLNCISN